MKSVTGSWVSNHSMRRDKSLTRMAVFRFIEGWYNRHRRHSGLDYESPATLGSLSVTLATL